MIIKQIFTKPETEVQWYFDSIEEIVIVYIRNSLRGTYACACNTLHLRNTGNWQKQLISVIAFQIRVSLVYQQ